MAELTRAASSAELERWLRDQTVLETLLEIARSAEPFAKVAEYTVLLGVLLTTLFIHRNVKRSAEEVRALQNAAERLKVQTQEAAADLEYSADNAIARIRAAIAEDLETSRQLQTSAITQSQEEVLRGLKSLIPDNERGRHTKWWQRVVDTKFDDPHQGPPRLYWKNNVRLQMPFPGTWLTAWKNDRDDGVCGVALSGKAASIDQFWNLIHNQAADLLRELPQGSTVEPGRFGIGLLRPNNEFQNDDERREWLKKTLTSFQQVLAPRMRVLLDQ